MWVWSSPNHLIFGEVLVYCCSNLVLHGLLLSGVKYMACCRIVHWNKRYLAACCWCFLSYKLYVPVLLLISRLDFLLYPFLFSLSSGKTTTSLTWGWWAFLFLFLFCSVFWSSFAISLPIKIHYFNFSLGKKEECVFIDYRMLKTLWIFWNRERFVWVLWNDTCFLSHIFGFVKTVNNVLLIIANGNGGCSWS